MWSRPLHTLRNASSSTLLTRVCTPMPSMVRSVTQRVATPVVRGSIASRIGIAAGVVAVTATAAYGATYALAASSVGAPPLPIAATERAEAMEKMADLSQWHHYMRQTDQHERMAIFSGRANPDLSRSICEKLGVPLGKITIQAYSDGEVGIQVNENVRGKDVYLVQPTCPPGVNDNLIELLLMVSTMRRASARRITAVIPYYGYARQDRKMASRVPISAADVARLLMAMGVDRVVAVDLHCGQIQGFFGPRTPCDNLEANVVALPYFLTLGLKGETTKVVSPDAGGVYRAKRFRENLGKLGVDAGMAMIVKQRVKAGEIGKMDLVGSVDGCDVIMVDDMIDTAGTLTKAAEELKKRGAKRVYAFATHGVFSGPAYERIDGSVLEKVVVCNSIPLSSDMKKPRSKIITISLADILAEAIARIQSHQSVSALFSETSPAGSTPTSTSPPSLQPRTSH